jgi:hypothetical protein
MKLLLASIAASSLRRWLPSRGNVVFTLLVLASLFFAGRAGALPGFQPDAPDAPSTSVIAYQGRLADAAGVPLTGNYGMTFALYPAATGGTALWTESRTVAATDGLFSVMLGEVTPIPASLAANTSLFLGVRVGSDAEMTPRRQLGSVAYAFQAITVPNGSITTDKLADGAVTLDKMVIEKYRFSYIEEAGSIIQYTDPNGLLTSLNPAICGDGQWCCNNSNSICYYNGTSDDSILQFSLQGAPSVACVLVHYDDDRPSKSKGLYYATDAGNQCNTGGPCASLSREGATDVPMILNTYYYWLCGW